MEPEFESAPQSISFLSFVFRSLGAQYIVVLAIAAILSLILTLIVVFRGRGAMAATALLLVVPAPLLVGVFAALEGAIRSYSVIATSPTAPKPSDVALGVSTALVAPLVGVLLMGPSYLIAVLGTVARSLSGESSDSKKAA